MKRASGRGKLSEKVGMYFLNILIETRITDKTFEDLRIKMHQITFCSFGEDGTFSSLL